jgi:hypothetical protein
LDSDGSALGTGAKLLELDSITATVNSQPYRLTERTQQWFDESSLTTYESQPADYTIPQPQPS